MASSAFNYSKWDKIELSDDESDLHPNIDKDSWFRLKHRTRLEREEKEDQEIKSSQQKNAEESARLNIIKARLQGISSGQADEDAEFEDTDALQIEAKELETKIAQRNARIEEINERRKWNIDNIYKVTDEKTIVNSNVAATLKSEFPLVDNEKSEDTPVAIPVAAPLPVTSKATSSPSASTSVPTPPQATETKPPTAPVPVTTTVALPASTKSSSSRDKLAVMNYNDYVIAHEQILETYSEIPDLEGTKEYLFKHCDVLLHEHSQSYMLLSSLEDEMNGKKKRMKLVSRQSQILSHIQELAGSMRRDPRDVVLPFFVRIEQKEYLTGFLSAVDEFIAKIQKRAVEKRKEMDADRAREAEESRPGMGPGGLDPMEVLENLPIALREAFESQDIQRLQDTLNSMDPKEAKFHMKQCVDSGLWVPKDSSVFDDVEEGDEEEVIDPEAAAAAAAELESIDA